MDGPEYPVRRVITTKISCTFLQRERGTRILRVERDEMGGTRDVRAQSRPYPVEELVELVPVHPLPAHP